MSEVTSKRVKVPGWSNTCAKCGHKWVSLGDKPPRACAGCKQIGWNRKPKPSA